MGKFLENTNFEALGSLLAMQGIIDTAPLMKKPVKKVTSSSSSESEQEEEKVKKKKKKEKKSKKSKKEKKERKAKRDEKKKKKKKKKKHESHSEDEPEKVEELLNPKKNKKAFVDENIPHHLVLHKLNDMIEELEREVKPDQVDAETAPNSVEASTAKDVISYPKVGVAYDPKQINTWSNLRGFQNPAQILQKSSWLGLTVAPGAVPSAIQPKSTAVKQDDGEECEDEPQNKQSSKKTSLFQDIFNERLPSPDRTEDDVPTQAFFRRKVPETVAEPTPKPVAKSNNLSKALQSRLQRRKLSIDDQ